MRQRWNVSGQRIRSSKNLHCCEDHFDMQGDSENWSLYKLTRNVKLRLKKHAVPREHKVLINTDNSEIQHFRSEDLREKRHPEKAVQVKPHFRSKGITCDLEVPNGKVSRTRKKKKCKDRQNRVHLPIMTVHYSSDDAEPGKPSILRRTRFHCSSENLNVNNDSDEAQQICLNTCDIAVQVFVRPSCHSKAVTCILPMLPLEKPKLQPRLYDKDNNLLSTKRPFHFPEMCLNEVTIESNDDHLSDYNLDYTFMSTNRCNSIFDGSYATFPSKKTHKQSTLKKEECSNTFEKLTLNHELAQIKSFIKKEVENFIKEEVENSTEENLMPTLQIKQEMMDVDELLPNDFVDCGIKQEPCFEEYTNSNFLFNNCD